MQWTSVVAIYMLFFVSSAFVLLPFGVKTADEVGIEKVPGQADSAPVSFSVGRHALKAAIMAGVLTTLYVLNYMYGWITADDINVFGDPPSFDD